MEFKNRKRNMHLIWYLLISFQSFADIYFWLFKQAQLGVMVSHFMISLPNFAFNILWEILVIKELKWPVFYLIPLFHTGHESPRIDFFLIRGDSWGFIKFFSPIVKFYESVPIQIRCRFEYSGESAQFGWNRARIHYDKHYNIRTCCTKVKESIKNQLRIWRMQHELATN